MERWPTIKSLPREIKGPLLAGFIRLVERTSQTVYEPGDLKDRLRAHRPFILAMWHGQFMMLANLNVPDVEVSAISRAMATESL